MDRSPSVVVPGMAKNDDRAQRLECLTPKTKKSPALTYIEHGCSSVAKAWMPKSDRGKAFF